MTSSEIGLKFRLWARLDTRASLGQWSLKCMKGWRAIFLFQKSRILARINAWLQGLDHLSLLFHLLSDRPLNVSFQIHRILWNLQPFGTPFTTQETSDAKCYLKNRCILKAQQNEWKCWYFRGSTLNSASETKKAQVWLKSSVKKGTRVSFTALLVEPLNLNRILFTKRSVHSLRSLGASSLTIDLCIIKLQRREFHICNFKFKLCQKQPSILTKSWKPVAKVSTDSNEQAASDRSEKWDERVMVKSWSGKN